MIDNWIKIKDTENLSDVPTDKEVLFYLGDDEYVTCIYASDEWIFSDWSNTFYPRMYGATHYVVLTPPKNE